VDRPLPADSNLPVTGWFSLAVSTGFDDDTSIFMHRGDERTDVTLSEIAAGIEVTDEQRDRGVATVDDTDTDLAGALAAYEDRLPCDAAAAAATLEAYAGGAAVGAAGREGGLVPVEAAKTLHLLGVEGVAPLSPRAMEVVEDWLSGRLDRAQARELAGASDREFALAAYVLTHDPLEGVDAVRERLRASGAATVEKRDRLAGTMSDVGDLL
jgi:hypothetical protein